MGVPDGGGDSGSVKGEVGGCRGMMVVGDGGVSWRGEVSEPARQ